MIKVLHIIQGLSLGGASRSMVAASKYQMRTGKYHHAVVSLLPTNDESLQLANDAGLDVIIEPDNDELIHAIEQSDIVQVEWWNNPEICQFFQTELPPMRLSIWCHVAGDHVPQIITKEIRDFADRIILACPYSYELPVIQSLPALERLEKAAVVYDPADFERLDGLWPKPHTGFNIGYIGTVDFVKMHPNFIPMSASIEIPDVQFLVCGGGIQETLKEQAQELGAQERFDFRGYVRDIRPVLEILDVYGYPLCEDTYAAGELNLQEAMFAGVPPVVFPYGGLKQLVVNDFTGLVVHNEIEYKQAVEYLFYHPEERARMGKNARHYASEIFGAENSAKKLDKVYRQLLACPKTNHLWGYTPDVDLSEQAVTLSDLYSPMEELSGARLFIQSLGEANAPFQISLTGIDDESIFAAEETIAKSSRLLASQYSGGILNYSKFFSDDIYLHLWSGLVLARQGRHSEAAHEFQRANELGFEHWRIFLYHARSSMECGDIYKVKELLDKVLNLNAECREARQLMEKVLPLIEAHEKELEEQRLALMAHIEFGNGFHVDEGLFRWIADEAHLIIRAASLSTPLELNFQLQCVNSEIYPQFPFIVKVLIGARLKRHLKFDADFKNETVKLILPASENDIDICILCSQFFIPAEKGMEDLRHLSVQFSQFNVKKCTDPSLVLEAETEEIEEPPQEISGAEDTCEANPTQTAEPVKEMSLEDWISTAGQLVAKKEIDQAIDLLFDGLNQYPQNLGLYQLQALLMVNTGAYRSAEKMIQKALEIEPDSAELYNQLGTILYLQGLYADSKNAYQKALEINPALEEAANNIRQIANL